MDYNQFIIENLPPVIKNIVKMVDKYSEYYKFKDIQVTVDDSDVLDIGSYVSTRSTCEFTVVVDYLLEGEEQYRTFYLGVPRMIDGVFIINGKYKLLSRELGEDNQCRWWGEWFRFKWGLSYNYETGLISVRDDEDGETYDLSYEDFIKYYPEKAELSEHQSAKLKIKLNLNYFPKKITKELLDSLDKIDASKTDILDKRILSIESILLNTLRSNALDICKQETHNFYNKGTISPGAFQKVIRGAFNGQLSSVNSLISSTNVNPISFDSSNQHIIIDHDYSIDENTMPGQYDWSMADIIDPVVTPDNANINRINHLTKSAGVQNGYISIKCYDKNFNPVEVDYVMYCASKVLTSDNVKDYNNRILKDPPYKIKENRIEKTSKEFDYIEPSPDDRLTVESRMIPMINMVDSVRGAMGAKMITQAVPLAHPDTPRVQSGHEGDASTSTTDIKYNCPEVGEVIKADEDSVIIMCNEIPHEYKIPTPAVGIYNITAVFTPTVKVGDKVKPNQTIIAQDVAKTGTTNLGLNALVALRPYRGLNYEDGIVISKSFAKRLSHYSIIDLTIMVRDDESIISLLPIGTKVKSRDVLVSCATRFRNQMNGNLIALMNPSDKSILKRNDLIVPNNVDDGIITDVRIQYNDYAYWSREIQKNVLDESSIKIIDKFKKNASVVPDSIPKEYLAQLPGETDYEGYAACIRYRILTNSPAMVGSKLSNRYGSKGLVAAVIPDEEMDRTEDGREIDVILNSDAVIARKNIAQIPEVYLSNIADVLKDKLKSGLENNSITLDEARELLTKYKLNNYSSLSDDELVTAIRSNKPFNYITGCFSRISAEDVLKWSDELNVTQLTKIIDGKTKRKVRNPILVGSMYMMKLFQLPEYANKVHTDDNEEDPILGHGLYRESEGLRQGALETFSLLASDLEPLVYSTRKKVQFQDAQNLLINLRLAGVEIDVKDNTKDK